MQPLVLAVILELQCGVVCCKRQIGGKDGIPVVEWLGKLIFNLIEN